MHLEYSACLTHSYYREVEPPQQPLLLVLPALDGWMDVEEWEHSASRDRQVLKLRLISNDDADE